MRSELKEMDVSKSQRPTYFLGNLVILLIICAIEGADTQLLPSTFRALEKTLGLTPTNLAQLGFAQAIMQALSGPFWASLADSGWSRKHLLVGGMLSWGILTLLLAMVLDFPSMMLLRALNGVALGSLMPISQSLIADMTQPHERGFFFGWVQSSLSGGMGICALFATGISNQVFLGYAGWRVAFATIALLSLLLATCLVMFFVEPERSHFVEQTTSISKVMEKLSVYMRISSFRIIVLQGVLGTIPWSAMSFMIMFLQYTGVSDTQAASVFVVQCVASMLGGVLGGNVADSLTRWSPFHGRPLTAQLSVASGIPIILVQLMFVPRQASSYPVYIVLSFLLGLLASWCAQGVNRPILTEVVGPSDRATIFGWLIALESSSGACFGAPLVGYLAEHVFGYMPFEVAIDQVPIAARSANADALATAMLMLTVLPWTLCFLVYSRLHWTYGRDIGLEPTSPTERTPITAEVCS